ncbi:MAG: hypothetical protein K6F59_00095 [Gammaproteobacteria bacterium]|nr:hypothetical protein [Gammaproteobacteria bacterium]
MIWWIILIEAVVFALIFTAIVFILTIKGKYSISNIHNYPPDIQEEYFKTHEKQDISYKSKKVIISKACGLLVFIALLTLSVYLAGGRTFLEGFLVGLGLMVWIGLYDTLFIDWVLFANLKMFRLEGTEHMDKAYHQKWFHFKGILFPGSIFGVIVASFVGLLTYLLGLI